jgi:hypothetical protein
MLNSLSAHLKRRKVPLDASGTFSRENLLNSCFLTSHQLSQLLQGIGLRRRQVHDYFQVWILAHLKGSMFQHQVSHV